MKKVLTIGEAIIDFIPKQKGKGLKDVETFTKKAGGAPANVAGGIAKLGGDSIFITQVGQDGFGDFLIEEIAKVGVDTTYINQTPDYDTSLAFVALDESGERDFIFFRKHAADLALDFTNVDIDNIDYDILHFCSVSLVDSPMKDTHINLIKHAKEQNKLVSFDPNLRLNLWPDTKSCIDTVNEFIKYSDILKISDDELELIFGTNDVDQVAKELIDNGLSILIYTMGGAGSRVYTSLGSKEVAGRKVEVVDTTGAGDSFIAAFLYQLSLVDEFDIDYLEQALDFANHYASITTTKPGAIEAMATKEEMEALR